MMVPASPETPPPPQAPHDIAEEGAGLAAIGGLVLLFGVILLAMLIASPSPGTQAHGLPPGESDAPGPVPGETYKWRPVAIGGGGFITGLSFDEQGRTQVARADVHGAYIWDAAADRWQPLVTSATMPDADRVQNGMNRGAYEVVVAPRNARRLFLAIKGQIYRSDDRGRHWLSASGGLPSALSFDANSEFRFYGPFMAVSPADENIVFLGTPANGLWRSSDGGQRWKRVSAVPAAADLRPGEPGVQAPGLSIWFTPDGQHVYVASPGHGLYGADAGGEAFAPLPPGGPPTVVALSFGRNGGFYALDKEAQRAFLFDGRNWVDLVKAGQLPATDFSGVAVRRDTGQAIVTDYGGKAWCQREAGGSWTRLIRTTAAEQGDPPWLGTNKSSYFASGQIAFDPVTPGQLWVAAGTGPHHAELGQSCLWPLSWQSRARGIEELVATDVVSAPGQAPLFGALDAGIHRKEDLNRFSTTYGPKPRFIIAAQQIDWSAGHPGFFVTNASDTRIGCCSEDGDSVLAGYSDDGGRSWRKFATLPQPPGTKADDPWRMAFGSIAVSADSVDNIVWMPGFNRAPFYTLDRGRSWTRIVFPGEILPDTGSFPNLWVARKTVAADRVRPGTFYIAHSGEGRNGRLAGLWRSTDGGRNWVQRHKGEIAPNSSIAGRLRAVPGRAGHLFFTSGMDFGDTRLRASTDGGANWTIVPRLSQIDDIGFGRPMPGTDYPTLFVSGRVDGRYGIWRSVDAGANWQRLAGFPAGRLDQVSVVEGDKNVFGRVYVGYTGSGWLYGEPAPCRPAAAGEECVTVGGDR